MNSKVRSAAEIISGGVGKYTSNVVKKLNQDSPNTSPANLDIYWGNSDHKAAVKILLSERLNDRDLEYEDFIEGLLVTYVRHKLGGSVKGYNELKQKYVEDLGWGKTGGRKGENVAGENNIWIGFLPKPVQNSIADNLRSQGLEFAEGFLEAYSRKNSTFAEFDHQNFVEVAAHEITHMYIANNTEIGKLQQKINDSEDVLSMSNTDFAEYIAQMEHKQEMNSQAMSIAHNDDVIAIEEVFSHFVGKTYLDDPDLSVSSGYSRKEYVDWGLEILFEKKKVDNVGVDWARSTAVEIFDEAANKGQLSPSGGRRDLFTIFLKHVLPNSEVDRLNSFTFICEEHLSKAFRDLKEVLKGLKNTERIETERGLMELRQIESNIEWNHPKEIEDKMLNDILEEAVGNYDLGQIHNLFEKLIDNEIEKLLKLAKALKNLEKETKDAKMKSKIEKVSREFQKVDSDLEEIK